MVMLSSEIEDIGNNMMNIKLNMIKILCQIKYDKYTALIKYDKHTVPN